MKPNRRTGRAARDLFRGCLTDGRLDLPRIRLIARRLAASRSRQGLSVLSAFERRVRLFCDRHTAIVVSAVPLGSDMRDGLRDSLTRLYGPALEAVFEDDPALIGGMRITVGSDVYDGSVRRRLAELEARL